MASYTIEIVSRHIEYSRDEVRHVLADILADEQPEGDEGERKIVVNANYVDPALARLAALGIECDEEADAEYAAELAPAMRAKIDAYRA